MNSAPAAAHKAKPKIEVISSKSAPGDSDEEDENMRMINEYLRCEEGDDESEDSDEEYFEQDPGQVTGIQEKLAKQSLETKTKAPVGTVTEKQPLKSVLKQSNAAPETDLDLPPLVSISAKSGNVVDQLPTIKSSASKSTSSQTQPARKGVSFADPGPKTVTEKHVDEDEDEDKFVVNMVRTD